MCTAYTIAHCTNVSCQHLWFFVGSDGQYTVTIVSAPAGTPVSGFTNTFDHPILSSVTLTCMVDPSPPLSAIYQWNTTECYTHSGGNPSCFPTGQTTKNATGNNLLAEDAGTITCTVFVEDVNFTSEPLRLRISGIIQYYSYIQ